MTMPEPLIAVRRNGGQGGSFDSFVQGSRAALRLNFCAKYPLLHQAANHSVQLL